MQLSISTTRHEYSEYQNPTCLIQSSQNSLSASSCICVPGSTYDTSRRNTTTADSGTGTAPTVPGKRRHPTLTLTKACSLTPSIFTVTPRSLLERSAAAAPTEKEMRMEADLSVVSILSHAVPNTVEEKTQSKDTRQTRSAHGLVVGVHYVVVRDSVGTAGPNCIHALHLSSGDLHSIALELGTSLNL